MPRYIDADALLVSAYHLPYSYNGAAWLQAINDAPTIDAVQVVRCGECYKKNTSWCGMKHERADMDYCSCGERRKP